MQVAWPEFCMTLHSEGPRKTSAKLALARAPALRLLARLSQSVLVGVGVDVV